MNTTRRAAAWQVAALGAVFAAPAGAAETGPALPSLLPTLASLLAVVAAIVAVGWLMRRMTPRGIAGDGILDIVATRSIGTRERVVLVEVGDQWVLVGVAPGCVNALATTPRGERAPPPARDPFARLLAAARGPRAH